MIWWRSFFMGMASGVALLISVCIIALVLDGKKRGVRR